MIFHESVRLAMGKICIAGGFWEVWEKEGIEEYIITSEDGMFCSKDSFQYRKMYCITRTII